MYFIIIILHTNFHPLPCLFYFIYAHELHSYIFFTMLCTTLSLDLAKNIQEFDRC